MKKITIALFVSTVILCCTKTFAQVIGAGPFHSFSICNDNTVRAWGNNAYGSFGNGTSGGTFPNPVPALNGLTGVVAITGGYYSTIALKNSGTVWSTGYNTNGQLGLGDLNNRNIPTQLTTLSGITAIAGGNNHTLALKNNGTVWAWGWNSYGEIGTGSTTITGCYCIPTPTQVGGLTGVIGVASAAFTSYVLKNNGTVWSWGFGQQGNHGTGDSLSSLVPVQALISNVAAIGAGYGIGIALKYDSTVWTWGENNYGQIGNGTVNSSGCYCVDTPTQVSGLTGVVAVAGSFWSGHALKSDGTVWGWGRNRYGELGVGDTLIRTTPAQATGLTGIVAIATQSSHLLALKNDGTLWACGYNNFGQLGDGTAVSTWTPVQVGSLCQPSPGCSAYFTVYPDAITPHMYWAVNYTSGTAPLHYDWNWGDGSPHDTIALPSHTYSIAGTYSICLTITDSTGCSDIHCYNSYLARLDGSNAMVYVNVISPNDIPEYDIKESFSVYPNPATSELKIQNAELKIKEIEIYNILGEKVLQPQTSNLKSQTVDVSQLLPGIYFVNIKDEEGNGITRKFVKM